MNVERYIERLKEVAGRAGFSTSWYGKIGETELPLLERTAAEDKPWIYVSSGVHGDEPAGPMAVLDLLQRMALPAGLNYWIFPLVNPTGLLLGTRENADGIDLNRDYGLNPRSIETRSQLARIGDRRFDLVFCLHEDDEGTGFYLYEHVGYPTSHDYAGLALRAAAPFTGIETRELVDGMPAENGRMKPPESIMDINRPDLPEALRLHFHHGPAFTFTTETPGSQPVEKRIRAQCAVVETILATFATEDFSRLPARD